MNAEDGRTPSHERMFQLLSAEADGWLEADERQELLNLLRRDPRARAAYAEQAILSSLLFHKARCAEGRAIGRMKSEAAFCGSSCPLPLPSSFLPSPPTIDRYPLTTTFIGGPVFSYMVATLILGVMLLSAWAYTITHDQNGNFVHKNSRGPTAPGWFGKTPELVSVGRITGMKDCRWSDPRTATILGAFVPLKRNYALASGLMEITYKSGATVILEGPCDYAVESDAGGYLARGKLTARVDSAKPQAAKTQDPRPKTQDQNPKSPSSLIPHPSSLFSVRTPTAIVTDLGTEFGVEVDRSGGCTAHVFQGSVRVRTSPGDNDGEIVDLRENESVRIATDGARLTAVRGRAETAAFVRPGQLEKLAREARLKPFRRWQERRDRLLRDRSLIAYYDFQQVDGSPAVLRNLADGGRKLDGEISAAAWTGGSVFGKHALSFRGGESDYVQIDIPREMNDVTVAARVWIARFDKESQGLLMSDGRLGRGRFYWHVFSNRRISLGIIDDEDAFIKYETDVLPESVLPAGRWALLAVVYDSAASRVTFYVNGEVVGERPIERHVPICIGPARIANWNPIDYPYYELRDRGLSCRMEEMAIFARALNGREFQQMIEVNAAGKEEKTMKQ